MTSILNRLFGKRTPERKGRSKRSGARLDIDEYSHGLVSIAQLDFVGHHAKSPNGNYRLIWADRTPDGTRGGNRESGHGSWSLLLNDRIVASGKLERPQEGKVAGNGAFILHDWIFGNDLQSRFTAYDRDGRQLIDQHFSANLMSNSLSPDGRYAICQTANAPGSDDSCQYMLFDLEARLEIARWEVETGWAEGYDWDTGAEKVIICLKDGERVAYDFTGAMIDRDGWQKARVAAGDLGVIKSLLGSQEGLSEEMQEEVKAGLEYAAREGELWGQARAYRLLGELHEGEGELAKAIQAYDEALTLDPKIGVARRADKLRRQMGQDEKKPARKKISRFEKQAQRLGVQHDVVVLQKGDGKDWRLQATHQWSSVELAALEYYRKLGWSGAASEGGLMLTLLKAASFPKLDPRNADTFIEALYAQNVAFDEDRFDKERLISAVSRATRSQIEANWKIISASAGKTPAFYPNVTAEHVFGLFKAIGAERLARIAEVFATAPYELRSGWPDLTLWKDSFVRFVEVKAPSDSIHASQARLISKLLRPLGFDVALAEIRSNSR